MESSYNEEFLQALSQGDSDAENRLIEAFQRSVLAKLRAHLRSPQSVEDASQEVFLRVLTYFRHGKTLRDSANLPAFIYKVCVNVVREHIRANSRHPRIPENAPEPASTEAADHLLIMHERSLRVCAVLDELPRRDRELLERIFVREEDKDHLCREFQINRDYLRVLVYRARTRLKTALACDSLQGDSRSRR